MQDSTVHSNAGVTHDAIACPNSNPNPVGGGLAIFGTDPHLDLEIHSTYPVRPPGVPGWGVDANNSSDTDAQMDVYAICAIDGIYKTKTKTVNVPAGRSRSAKVSCPRGMKVTGGGGLLTGGDHSVEIGSTAPADGPDANSKPDDAWSVSGNNGTGSPIPLTVEAVCTKHTGRYRTVHSQPLAVGNNSSSQGTVECPDTMRVSGGGVRIKGSNTGFEVNSSVPIDTSVDADTVPDNGWAGTAYNDGSGKTTKMTVFAICESL